MAKERILVIDDDPDTIEFLQIVFSVRGREVAGALSGADGLRLAREQSFDLIIVDVMMPDVDGYEVCRQLRADPITANVPLTILTARGRPIDEARGLAARRQPVFDQADRRVAAGRAGQRPHRAA